MATYRKTAKGLAEISTRANKLPPRVRTALILVDGRRTDFELSTMLATEADATLRWLSDSGFIEVDHAAPGTIASPASGAPSTMPAPAANTSQWPASTTGTDTLPPRSLRSLPPEGAAPAWERPGGGAGPDTVPSPPREPPPAARKPIAQIQREVVRELTELVGPMADNINMKIEKSRSREELKPLLEIAFQVLANTRGSTAAQSFREKHIEGL